MHENLTFIFIDQPTNCRYICKEWEIRIEIDTNVKREEVEKLVNDFMAGEKGNKMRQKIVELKKKAKEATTPSGCSFMNLGKFIKEPKQLLDFALNILASDSRSSSVPFAVVLKHHNDPLLIISGTNQGCREISLLQQQQGMHNQLGMSSSGSQGLHMLQSEATNVGGNATIGTGGGFPDFVCIGSGKQDIGISGLRILGCGELHGILIVLDIPLREWVAITVIQTLRIMDWWLKDKGFQNLVKLEWGNYHPQGWGGLVLKQKIKFIKQRIRQWSISQGHISTRKVLNLKRELKALENAYAVESMLRQKARVRWLKEGDNNSNYFHRLINHRRRQNAIQGLFINGMWVHDPSSVKNVALHYFKSRFAEENTSRPTLDGVQFPSLPTREKESLVARFSEVEIKSAVWDCGSNASFIALIPKIKDPQSLNDYRPISLIGCVYKIVAKILAKRLALVLPHFIDERQTTFMKGRHILHGVLIANEVIVEAKLRKKPCMVFKVDFEKAYDSVSWGFLDYMLMRMGFCERWRKWINVCMSSATISILINGSPSQEFVPKRGLRQGDPLAPLLFNIVVEGLTGLMRSAVAKNLFSSYHVGNKKEEINILQYADDTLFFGAATNDNVRVLKCILKCFELVFGLKINYNKSQFGCLGVSSKCRMGFCLKWRKWINACNQSATISILINGNPTKEFVPTRGLYRSYLVGKQKVPVNILQYADDTVFMGEALWDNVIVLKAMLRGFEMASRLKINFSKSNVGIFGDDINWVHDAAHFLKCRQMETLFHYLGIPIVAKPSSCLVREPLIKKFEAKLSKWNQKFLSMTVPSMGSFCESGWEWSFSWRRNLFDNEIGRASEFIDQTAAISPSASLKDSWHLWNIKIPPRALVLAWRLLWDRLPTKDNLIRRHVTNENDLCPFCQNKAESATHLFFLCHKVVPLWWEFNSWVKEPRVFHCRPMDNFLQHSPMAGLKDTNTRWKIWWIAATTSIWKLRNDIIFNNHPFVISNLVDNTIFLSWSWMRGWEKDFNVPFHQWRSYLLWLLVVLLDPIELQCALLKEMGLTYREDANKVKGLILDTENRDDMMAAERGIKKDQ
ncbi:LINE-1 reverse transcriptase-like [Glycine soja]|uniref:LINE-1 reverse transcriptase-like n=1 Tax=Glycine soja TaxID=3848 RepID=A0A445KL08_GLYSO|nr:LINE-1 reverse transcriptase-like [Glycine soja]